MWRCSVTHLMPGCKLICLVGCLCRSFKCSPLLSSTQLVFGVVLESCESSTSRSHLTSQRSFIRMHVWRVKWRLLTLSTQDGKEEEEEEEGEVSVTLSTLSSSRHCILDDVMWNYGAFLQPNSFFFLLLGYASFTGRCRRIIWVENKELKKKKSEAHCLIQAKDWSVAPCLRKLKNLYQRARVRAHVRTHTHKYLEKNIKYLLQLQQ